MSCPPWIWTDLNEQFPMVCLGCLESKYFSLDLIFHVGWIYTTCKPSGTQLFCSPVAPTNGRGSYTLHPRSTPPVDTPPRSFLPMLQLHFLASDDRVCCSIGASLARKWSCSIGKNDRGGMPTGEVLLGCNV